VKTGSKFITRALELMIDKGELSFCTDFINQLENLLGQKDLSIDIQHLYDAELSICCAYFKTGRLKKALNMIVERAASKSSYGWIILDLDRLKNNISKEMWIQKLVDKTPIEGKYKPKLLNWFLKSYQVRVSTKEETLQEFEDEKNELLSGIKSPALNESIETVFKVNKILFQANNNIDVSFISKEVDNVTKVLGLQYMIKFRVAYLLSNYSVAASIVDEVKTCNYDTSSFLLMAELCLKLSDKIEDKAAHYFEKASKYLNKVN